MSRAIMGWWFAAKRVLPHGDGRRIAVGRTHRVKGEIVPCKNGLHLSVRCIDAMRYAPGNIVYRIRGHGTVVTSYDKACCSHRTYVAGGIDVSGVLRKFARLCALDVIYLWEAPPVVLRFLRTGDEKLRDAAWDAAWAAAWDAAWGAARDAAIAAARGAVIAAARDAARGAAIAAARDAAIAAASAAARGAARDAARGAASAAARDAARAAAIAAARDAARAAQNKRLHRMLMQAIRDAR